MTEVNKFQSIDTLPLYDDGIGKVTLYDASHANESEEQRIWTVTTLASIAYGNEEAKNPEALYKRLQELKHESLWEMVRSNHINGGRYIENSMRHNMTHHAFTDEFKQYSTPDEDSKWHKQNIACFRIKAPVFVARQFFRHRAFSYIEMSRRYTKDSKVPFEFYCPKLPEDTDSAWEVSMYYDEVIRVYEQLIDDGLHTQVASRFLPQTTYTEWYMMGEVEGLKNFFTLRCSKHSQEEIRELSIAMLKLLSTNQPELYQKVLP